MKDYEARRGDQRYFNILESDKNKKAKKAKIAAT